MTIFFDFFAFNEKTGSIHEFFIQDFYTRIFLTENELNLKQRGETISYSFALHTIQKTMTMITGK